MPLAWRIVLRLRPGSAPRRRALHYGLQHTFAAVNRRDFDVVLLGMEREAEMEFPGVELPGIASSYHGPRRIPCVLGRQACATGSKSPTGSRQ